jgi:hypothetical protein
MLTRTAMAVISSFLLIESCAAMEARVAPLNGVASETAPVLHVTLPAASSWLKLRTRRGLHLTPVQSNECARLCHIQYFYCTSHESISFCDGQYNGCMSGC